MSEPATELFERMQKFMRLNAEQRDEALYLTDVQMKGQIRDMEASISKLVKSNAALQKAIYIATGVVIAAKFYLDYFHKP